MNTESNAALDEAFNPRQPWWDAARGPLLDLAQACSPCYVYDLATIRERVTHLQRLRSVDRLFYAVKANAHEAVLDAVHEAGLGFQCVSCGELDYVLSRFPDLDRERLLFTPNFISRSECDRALASQAQVTLDSLYPLQHWPDIFEGRSVHLRVDIGHPDGHHRHVQTAGDDSKFGIPAADLLQAAALASSAGVRVIGLHAHCGSGIMNAAHWGHIGEALAELAATFPELEVLNLGGGLGVPDHALAPALDLDRLDADLSALRDAHPELSLWLEPGRYLVAEAGVLLTRATQTKRKADRMYLGVDTGMNSLIRPALYDAWHEIVNVSRSANANCQRYTVVGPLCESGDVLGRDRELADTREGDVLLIANAGAYGRVMSSHYNMRSPASERVIDAGDNTQAQQSTRRVS